MKSHLAIAVVLSALLVGVVVAKDKNAKDKNDKKLIPYSSTALKYEISENMGAEDKWLSDLADSYKKEAEGKDADEAAKYWMAAHFVSSLGAIRITLQLETFNNLHGKDYYDEYYYGYYAYILKARYKADEPLKELVRLGSELKGSTISKDVVEIMKKFDEYQSFIERRLDMIVSEFK